MKANVWMNHMFLGYFLMLCFYLDLIINVAAFNVMRCHDRCMLGLYIRCLASFALWMDMYVFWDE